MNSKQEFEKAKATIKKIREHRVTLDLAKAIARDLQDKEAIAALCALDDRLIKNYWEAYENVKAY